MGIGSITVELTRRVNDFEMVYLERNTRRCGGVITVTNFNREENVVIRHLNPNNA